MSDIAIKKSIDNTNTFLILLSTITISILGLINLWDFTPIHSYVANNFGSNDSLFLVKRQLMWLAVGVLAFSATWYAFKFIPEVKWFFVFAIPMLQLMMLFTDIGISINGGIRHIHLFGTNVYVNIWIVLMAAPATSIWLMQINVNRETRILPTVLSVWLLLVNILFIMQNDLPMMLLFNLIAFGMSFLSRGRKKLPVLIVTTVIFVIASGSFLFVVNSDYRFQRLMSTYDYTIDPYGAGYQARIAHEDFDSGGFTGLGFGSYKLINGDKWQRYVLPETITTHALQITGRQMGALGIGGLFIIWASLLIFGKRLAEHSSSDFDHLLKIGAILFLAGQVIFSFGRTLNVLPLLPSHHIPFLSYGGSVTIAAFVALAIITKNSENNVWEKSLI